MFKNDTELETHYFQNTMQCIEENISRYTADKEEIDRTVTKLIILYNSGNPELFNELATNINTQESIGSTLAKNMRAKDKPYFGKIIVEFLAEKNEDKKELYIGKGGISKYRSNDLLVIDWRAPIADLYYKSGLGESSYTAPEGEITVDISLKRSFDIESGKLNGFYDSEEITNDELLQKYLSKNKDVVLKDIVSSIQKEQNTIIRGEPWRNLIVQGVAGSGKTTVAMHRIAYLLYNFDDQLKPQNFYVIASNQLFLNYITSMLPELDVQNINQSVMKDFLLHCIECYDAGFTCPELAPDYTLQNPEDLILMLETYFAELESSIFVFNDKVNDKEVISKKEIASYLRNFKELDLFSKAEILDNRLNFIFRNNGIISEHHANYARVITKYRAHFKNKVKRLSYKKILKIVLQQYFQSNNLKYSHKAYNLTDLALMMLICRKLKPSKEIAAIKHVVIDEAQDFHLLIYYALYQTLSKAKFTIVGDVMQNIAEGGTDGWESVQRRAFLNKAAVYTLNKSYRNTIEISRFANQIIHQYLNSNYLVEPVIRHGSEVAFHEIVDDAVKKEKLQELLTHFKKQGYNLVSIICKTSEAGEKLYHALSGREGIYLMNRELDLLQFGTYIGSVENNKGLEYDAVVIWDADDFNLNRKIDAKLFYVAATRALHELHIFTGNKELYLG